MDAIDATPPRQFRLDRLSALRYLISNTPGEREIIA
jgi:hypothetical protein